MASMPPTPFAAVVLVRTVADPSVDNPHQGRMDLIGRDCTSVEEALGHIRDVLTKLDSWEIASIVPRTTIAELAARDIIVDPV